MHTPTTLERAQGRVPWGGFQSPRMYRYSIYCIGAAHCLYRVNDCWNAVVAAGLLPLLYSSLDWCCSPLAYGLGFIVLMFVMIAEMGLINWATASLQGRLNV